MMKNSLQKINLKFEEGLGWFVAEKKHKQRKLISDKLKFAVI